MEESSTGPMCKGLLSARKSNTPGVGTRVLIRCLKIVRYRLLETEEKLERKPGVNMSTDTGCGNLAGRPWARLEPEPLMESQPKEESWGDLGVLGGLCALNDPRHCLGSLVCHCLSSCHSSGSLCVF